MKTSPPNEPDFLDVVIVGAGLSGIGAAYHIRQSNPAFRYAILEARDGMGGTWDLFRYPGVRSDSDMHTLGYSFRPWTDARSVADGPSILRYIKDTAEELGIDRAIRFGHKVVSAEWSSAEARWHLSALRTDTGETVAIQWRSSAASSYSAPAITTTTRATRRSIRDWLNIAERSSTPNGGTKRSTMRTSGWSSSAAAQPR